MLAVTARVIDDRESLDWLSVGCGSLWKNLATDTEDVLTLREACNKIIHYKKIRFDVDEDERGQTYLNPIVYVYGDLNGKDWKAKIDIVAFATDYVSILRHY